MTFKEMDTEITHLRKEAIRLRAAKVRAEADAEAIVESLVGTATVMSARGNLCEINDEMLVEEVLSLIEDDNDS